MSNWHSACLVFCLTVLVWIAAPIAHAQSGPIRVFWWNNMPGNEVPDWTRKVMADFLNAYEPISFQVDYHASTRRGALARTIAGKSYDILVLDVTEDSRTLNSADADAIRDHYVRDNPVVMLDGTFWIRSTNTQELTRWPGPNNVSADLLINQLVAIAENGGGVLIGTDHDRFQVNANIALSAILPDAAFRGKTNPSTNGEFFGKLLLGQRARIRAQDVLRHWEAVPSQGEAPVGTFRDVLGRSVTLHALVETADKPGGGRKRPYISVNIDPGALRTDIDSDAVFENLPTHKAGGS